MGRVAPLMFIVDMTVQWCISSQMCWVVLLDRFMMALGQTIKFKTEMSLQPVAGLPGSPACIHTFTEYTRQAIQTDLYM